MTFRPYDPARDLAAVHRIWQEIGWGGDSDKDKRRVSLIVSAGRTLVADVAGGAECLATTLDSRLRYLDEDLPLSVVAAVATSRVARRQKLASRITAEAIAADAAEKGHAVAILGIFDQGFYDRIGFGTGTYLNYFAVDPGTLDVPMEPRSPIRLTGDDHERMHANYLARRPVHGAVTILPADSFQSEVLTAEGSFGLGYEGPDGRLTHHFWMTPSKGPAGPYQMRWLVYETLEQCRELLAVLQSLGDQVRLVRMAEPAGIQLQDLIRLPFRRRTMGWRGDFETSVKALAWWQVRILDLPACLAKTRLPGTESLTFNLTLTDPIERFLSDESKARWAGVGGDYVVTLGPESAAAPAPHREGLPVLRTSVGTFTRMWLGAARPSGLAMTTGDVDAPPDLVDALERVLRLPEPQTDADF